MSRDKLLYLKENLPPGSEEGAKWTALLHPRLTHGGPASRGKRKAARPYFSNVPQVFLLNSKRARGRWDLAHRRHRSRITSQIYVYAKRFRVRVFRASVAKGQIRVLVKASTRKDLADFFRVLAGRTAVFITGARKGAKRIGRFWDELCFSKMIPWGREFHRIQALIQTSNIPLHLGEVVLGKSPHNPLSRGS